MFWSVIYIAAILPGVGVLPVETFFPRHIHSAIHGLTLDTQIIACTFGIAFFFLAPVNTSKDDAHI